MNQIIPDTIFYRIQEYNNTGYHNTGYHNTGYHFQPDTGYPIQNIGYRILDPPTGYPIIPDIRYIPNIESSFEISNSDLNQFSKFFESMNIILLL